MNYTKPTTVAQMYASLEEIFNYYRGETPEYDTGELRDLVIVRMDYAPKTDEELTATATTLLLPEHIRAIADKKAEISDKISTLTDEKQTAEREKVKLLGEIKLRYTDELIKHGEQVLARGLTESNLSDAERNKIVKEKIREENDVEKAFAEKLSKIDAEINALNQKLSAVESEYEPMKLATIEAKKIELKEADLKLGREVLKYNNTLSEKEQRYANTLTQTRANLELKFLDINKGEYTKDELIRMGYYNDAMNCVLDYYETLSVSSAYNGLLQQTELMFYLDDYYNLLVDTYRMRNL